MGQHDGFDSRVIDPVSVLSGLSLWKQYEHSRLVSKVSQLPLGTEAQNGVKSAGVLSDFPMGST
jgi:hypothetical protein